MRLTTGAGEFDAGGKNVLIAPSGEFRSEHEIGDVSIGATAQGAPLYLRDVADVVRSYDRPARFLSIATFITLLLVPVFYSICMLDLKIVKWEQVALARSPQGEPAAIELEMELPSTLLMLPSDK